MGKLNFTPGPWQFTTNPLETLNHDHGASVWRHNGEVGAKSGSALICDTSCSVGYEQCAANARLIAKSPDMLAHHIKDIENLRGLAEIVRYADCKQIIQAMIDQKEALLKSI